MDQKFNLSDVRNTRNLLSDYVIQTPVHQLHSPVISRLLGSQSQVYLKLELFQHTGTFKVRGAINSALNLPSEKVQNGFTAVSAGNHAIATAFTAKTLKTTSKVVMIKTANQLRVAKCREYGGEIVFADDAHSAFDLVEEIQRKEGYTFLHPFEGRNVSLGTATLGLEFSEQVDNLDAVVVAIGGGGLASGVSMAIKELKAKCQVYGVEPEGADTMRRSFQTGKPESIDQVNTIADSLGAPYALDNSFALCRKYIDDLVLVSDQEMVNAMALLLSETKLVVEPAGAASLAAVLAPLRSRLFNKRIGLIVCGSNIDLSSFKTLIDSAVAFQ